jgi:hypothetical protein
MDSSTEVFPSSRTPSTGTHAQFCPGLDGFERHVAFLVVLNQTSGFGRAIQQGADGAAGLAARPEFKHLTEQHEHDNHRRRLEINSDFSIRRKGIWKRARHEHHHCAEQIGRANANGDEREHIQVSRDE